MVAAIKGNQYLNGTLSAALLLAGICFFAGCGGGGRDAGPSGAASYYPASYVLVERASGDVGPELSRISYDNTFLVAALPSGREVTLAERFYTSGRPMGIVGKVFDIQPDNLPFKEGTQLCISTSGTGYSGRGLVIVTGQSLDQPLESLSSSSRVCAYLEHSSPYSLAHARNLGAKEYTIFGALDAKENPDYTVKITSSTENHDSWGSMFVVNITVHCDYQCMVSGEREFRFMAGQQQEGSNILDPLPDDLLIVESGGTYPLWTDSDGMPWIHLRTPDGVTVGGIAYLLAAEYVSYFLGPGKMSQYIDEMDPNENSIQRFFFRDGRSSPYLFVEITRNETDMPGMIRILVKKSGETDKTYMVDRSTAEITKSWNSPNGGVVSVSAAPGDSGYDEINRDLLYMVHSVVGLDDTPDETRGDARDLIPRYLPIQELFAVNVLNLLRGLGWHNLEAIEIYYRDRLELWNNSQV
ncbi:hypothetical protein ACFLQK_01030 [bacterium]